MDKFIHRENLALYKKRLAETTDERTRQVIGRGGGEGEASGSAAEIMNRREPL
jgi:hypothetical protein